MKIYLVTGVLVVEEMKSSCRNEKTFLPMTTSIKKALSVYIDHIRPCLSRGGRNKSSVRKVDGRDLKHAHVFVSMPHDEFFLKKMEAMGSDTKKKRKWGVIFDQFAPDGGWATPDLTPEALRTAYAMSDYQKREMDGARYR